MSKQATVGSVCVGYDGALFLFTHHMCRHTMVHVRVSVVFCLIPHPEMAGVCVQQRGVLCGIAAV